MSELNDNNTTKTISTHATPLLTYSSRVIGWTNTELKDFQIKTRNTIFRLLLKHGTYQ